MENILVVNFTVVYRIKLNTMQIYPQIVITSENRTDIDRYWDFNLQTLLKLELSVKKFIFQSNCPINYFISELPRYTN